MAPVDSAAVPRPTASVVILAWNTWPMTRDCLAVISDTLGPGDEVIVVDNGSTDETPAELAGRAGVRVLTNPLNRGFAGGCNDGARLATGDVVVFLNNDTLPVGAWLDELLAPFEQPAVGATGPRSNFVSGPQLVPDVPYRDLPSLRAFVAGWERDHTGRVAPLARLVGFCLAVRRSAFEQVGGFDEGFGTGGYEDDDLCRRLAAQGWQLLVADGSYLHHHGHATFDANGLDWQAIELRNQERFEAKHGAAPTLDPTLGSTTPTREVFTAAAVLTDHPEDALVQSLVAAGLVVRTLPRLDGEDAYAAVDALEPRADLVVLVGVARGWPGADRLEVPVVAWGDRGVGAPVDLEVDAARAPGVWVPAALDALGHGEGFGPGLLACRRLLEAGDVVGAIDAVARAEAVRPGTPQAANAMAVCAHALGQHAEALSFVRRALAVAPDFGPALDNLHALGGA